MSDRTRIVSLTAIVALLAGCYHVTVVTGLPEGTSGIHKEWAPGFIFGLVPPETIESAKTCTNGVAKVETQQSFLNGLVSVVTFGIFTPWQIDVVCASSGKMGAIPAGAEVVKVAAGASTEQLKAAFEEASARSARDGVPVYVSF